MEKTKKAFTMLLSNEDYELIQEIREETGIAAASEVLRYSLRLAAKQKKHRQ